jgi:putative flavoprotein involved in K+ transport
VSLRRADGSERRMRPRHLVMANGVSSIPVMPRLPGLEEFRGTVRHSSQYGSGLDWRGKRALVIGTGTSGHDVAQDLAVSGAAEVTLVQRRPTQVVSLKEAQAPYAFTTRTSLRRQGPPRHLLPFPCAPRATGA